ncbi:UrcA family protein [Sphingomonas sp.]|uniref:UrcA family protein n=1 Tax=Sphingomonas sp. TaxID=28214 RepID=UPI001DE5B575|nr:UrcA family protein [Sphingomonas sp.]MBX9797452.1 UrcA family protein [Sphingomonas sp.]
MRITLVAAALLAAALPACAQAQDIDTPRVTVSVAGLDLASPGGVNLLDRRLWQAADAVCGGATPATHASMREQRQCRAAVLRNVAAQRDAAIQAARRQPTLALVGVK